MDLSYRKHIVPIAKLRKVFFLEMLRSGRVAILLKQNIPVFVYFLSNAKSSEADIFHKRSTHEY